MLPAVNYRLEIFESSDMFHLCLRVFVFEYIALSGAFTEISLL